MEWRKNVNKKEGNVGRGLKAFARALGTLGHHNENVPQCPQCLDEEQLSFAQIYNPQDEPKRAMAFEYLRRLERPR